LCFWITDTSDFGFHSYHLFSWWSNTYD
jgi:hypothetical protein